MSSYKLTTKIEQCLSSQEEIKTSITSLQESIDIINSNIESLQTIQNTTSRYLEGLSTKIEQCLSSQEEFKNFTNSFPQKCETQSQELIKEVEKQRLDYTNLEKDYLSFRQQKSNEMEDFIIYRITVNELKKLLGLRFGNNGSDISLPLDLVNSQQMPLQSLEENRQDSEIQNDFQIVPKTKIFIDLISDSIPNVKENLEKLFSSVSFIDKPDINCNAAFIVVYQSGARINKPERVNNEILSVRNIGINNVGLIILRLVTGDKWETLDSRTYPETNFLGQSFVIELHFQDMKGTFTFPSRTNDESFKTLSKAFECLQLKKSIIIS